MVCALVVGARAAVRLSWWAVSTFGHRAESPPEGGGDVEAGDFGGGRDFAGGRDASARGQDDGTGEFRGEGPNVP